MSRHSLIILSVVFISWSVTWQAFRDWHVVTKLHYLVHHQQKDSRTIFLLLTSCNKFPFSWEWQPALCIDWSSTNSDNKRPQNFSICCNYCKTLTPNARDWQRPYLRIHRGFNSHILHQIPTGEFDKIQFPRHHKYFLNHWNVAPPLQEAVEDDQVWTKTSCLPAGTQLYLGSSSSPFDAQSRVTRFGNKSDSSQLGHWQIQTTQIDSGPKLCRAD